MNFAEAIHTAIKTSDAALAGRIVDKLRFTHGFNNDSCFAMFRRNAPDPNQFNKGDFESLMLEADTAEDPG